MFFGVKRRPRNADLDEAVDAYLAKVVNLEDAKGVLGGGSFSVLGIL